LFSPDTFKGRAGDHHVELAAASVALVRRANVHRARQRRQQLGLEPRARHGVRHCRNGWRGGVAVAVATVAVVMRRIRASGFFLVAVPVPVVVSRVVVSRVAVVDAAARIAAACRCTRRGRRGSYLHGRRRRVGHHDARGLEAGLDVYTSKRLPA